MQGNEKDSDWKNIIANMSVPKHNAINVTSNLKPHKAINITKAKIRVKLHNDNSIHIGPSTKHLSLMLTKFSQNKAYYCLDKKEWIVKLEIYDTIRKELKKYYTFTDIPKGLVNGLLKYSQQNCHDFKLSDCIYNQLLPFQREAVKFALSKNGRILLADEMGLGKTYQALAIANFYQIEWPLLIISPASLLENWRNSIKNYLKLESTIIRKASDFGDRICIVSYDIATRLYGPIEKINFKVIIVDEIHYLKSATTKRCRTLLPILQNSDRLILISGTPALSRPIELYSTFMALNKTLFSSMTEYGYRYCNLRKKGNFYDWKGSSNLDELYLILNSYFMIRRTKDEVMSELPSKFRRQVMIDAKKNNKKNDIDIENLIENTKPVDETIIGQYIDACDAKIDAIIDYLKDILEKNQKFLIFAHHTKMLDSIEAFLKEKIAYVRIDGKTPSMQRQKLVDRFQNEDNIKVAVLSLTSCSSGLTFTAARIVIFAELYWNPGTLLQAEDRAHRIGQRNNVDIHYIIALGTVDEYVWPLLLKKLNVLEKMGIGNNELKSIKSVSIKQEKIHHYFQSQ